MGNRADRLYNWVGTLASRVRAAGGPDETWAAETILNEISVMGGAGCIETFEFGEGVSTEASFETLAPYSKTYTVTGYRRSMDTPKGGQAYDFTYVEDALPANLLNVKGKCVLINGYLSQAMYIKLRKAEVAAILTYNGTYMDDPAKTDLDTRKIRPELAQAHGNVVAVNMRAKDAQELVISGADKVKISVKNRDFNATSRNVVAVIPGSENNGEMVCIGGHYDTVNFARGAYDNASGSGILLELYRHFKQNPPKRTMRFCWYGAEEQGLLGSKHDVAAHTDELTACRMMFNIDLAGTAMGKNFAIVTGEEALLRYVDALYQQAGEPVEVKQDIYSSDCMPFVDMGIPAINLGRFGAQGQHMGHDRYDTMEFISAKSLEDTYRAAELVIENLTNAAIMPFKRVIPDDIREKADKYLGKVTED